MRIVRNVAVLVLTYAAMFLATRAVIALHGDWKPMELVILAAEVAGLLAAIAFRVRFAAYILGAAAAFSAAELTLHTIYGICTVQSAPTHLAVLLAAALGIAMGALVTTPRTA